MIKKKLLSAFTLRAAYKKGFKQGSLMWKVGFFVAIAFKIFRWFFAKPSPTPVEEYELAPGEYRVVVDQAKESKK